MVMHKVEYMNSHDLTFDAKSQIIFCVVFTIMVQQYFLIVIKLECSSWAMLLQVMRCQ